MIAALTFGISTFGGGILFKELASRDSIALVNLF